MIHLVFLAAALLHLQDPAGDAVGDGSLVPPTAPIYANTSDFDLQGVTVTDAKQLTVRVTMGALSNPGGLPNGFSNPVIDVYLDTGTGGAQKLLPGSGMTMPPKRGWNVALRVDGDEAFAVEAHPQGGPTSWPRLPVTVERQGTSLILHTALPRPEHVRIFALVGVYDPFRKDAWRPLSATPSPWAFSSSSQHVPVIDVLAPNHGAQRRAIDGGVLIPYRAPMPGLGWLLLMLLGVVVAAGGAFLRRRVRPLERSAAEAEQAVAEGAGVSPQADEEIAAAVDGDVSAGATEDPVDTASGALVEGAVRLPALPAPRAEVPATGEDVTAVPRTEALANDEAEPVPDGADEASAEDDDGEPAADDGVPPADNGEPSAGDDGPPSGRDADRGTTRRE